MIRSTQVGGSYEYRSHLPPPPEPIQSRAAQLFARTMRRARANPGTDEARELFGAHPLLVEYEKLAARLHETHRINSDSWGASGLLRHLGLLLGWPVTDAEWKAVVASGNTMPREREKGERARSNKELGKRADREIIATINDQVAPLASSLHRYSKWFFMYLYQRRWLPLDAQLPLWSADQRTVRTWADVVCYSLEERRLVLIELKTGYAYHYTDVLTLGGGGPIEHTAYNQHQMQLGWMHARLTELAGTEEIDAYVVRVNSEEGIPRPHPLDDLARDYFANSYPLLNSATLVPTPATAEEPAAEEPAAEVPDLLALLAARRRKPTVSRAKRPKKRKEQVWS